MSGSFDPPDDDPEMLAAEYALGLLNVAQLPHVVAARHGGRFDAAVHKWEAWLAPLAEAAAPVQPDIRVWSAIEAAISPTGAPAAGLWDNLKFWRYFGLGTGALVAALGVALIVTALTQAPPLPIATATLTSQHAGIFVATVEKTGAGLELVVSPSQVIIPAHKSAELWIITPGNDPAPLGLLASNRPVTVNIPAAQLSGDIGLTELAVSIEPTGGSPTGHATGPVISAAKFLPL